jgi:Spy/CpxP family protein refolding chaperone
MSKTKRFIRAAAITVALLGAGVGIVQAAPHWGGGPVMGHEGGPRGWHHRGHGHDDMDLHGVKLTEKQQDQLFKLKHDAEPLFHEKMKALRQTHDSLRQASSFANYNPAKVRQLAEVQAKQIAELHVLRIEQKHKAFAVLTPEQKKQVLEREQRRERSERGPE